MFFVQSKGTKAIFDDDVKMNNFPVKTIKYALLFNVPFFVFYTSITSKETKFIWLQKYVEIELNKNNPTWKNKDSVTLYFPEENNLGKNINKINHLLEAHRATSQSLIFLIIYEELLFHTESVLVGQYGVSAFCIKLCEKLIKTHWVINYYSVNLENHGSDINIFNLKDTFEDILNNNIITSGNRILINKQIEILDSVKTVIIASENFEKMGY
uniref:hypothetical protein n=1 Tax=Photorhabdus sp. RM322S TaxID=3342825 RepID=UPI0036D9BCBB